MKFVTARDLRNKTAQIWESLSQEDELVVTVNGRPVALITPVSESSLEDTLKILRRTKAQQALLKLRLQSIANKTNKFSVDNVQEEIRQVRRSRKS